MYHILTYHFVRDYLSKRTPHRKSHFRHLEPFLNREVFLLGGATAGDGSKGVLIFKNLNKAEIAAFVHADPYYNNGIVDSFSIEEWTVVAGCLY